MSILEQAKRRRADAEAAAELAAMRRDAERVNISDSARSEGAGVGYQQGLQEGALQVAGFKQKLMDLFGQRQEQPAPAQGLAGRYAEEGQDLRRQMERDAQQEAFMRARSMRDTSEGNMNTLISEELKRRGL